MKYNPKESTSKKLVEFLIATILLFTVYFGFIPYRLTLLNSRLDLPSFTSLPLAVGGWLLVVSETLVYLSTMRCFLAADSTPFITHSPRNAVVSSLYARSRNPMYIGHLVLIFGEYLIYGSFLVLLFLLATALGLHLLVVLYEEPLTKSRLGKHYEEYLSKVPRWL